MMGNLSMGLKSHAVTMFEVGKLANESLASFMDELSKVCGHAATRRSAPADALAFLLMHAPQQQLHAPPPPARARQVQPVTASDGDAQRYFEHAVVLFRTLQFLRGGAATAEGTPAPSLLAGASGLGTVVVQGRRA